jgi:LysR family transcriptional regulator, glycine cleavage system transcriptional activator
MLRLPPLNALRAFEAAARHTSFSRAAEELCVTAGAVSQQIVKLESHLGTKLFVRRHAQVSLTPAGEVYLQEVREAFQRIAQATHATRNAGLDERLLRLKVPPTCAARWLVPRLAHFHADHPDISIQLATSHDAVDFARDEVDAAVHYGRAVEEGLEGVCLLPEELVPVCRQDLLDQKPVRVARDLVAHVLLHSIRRPNDWVRWFDAAGFPGAELGRLLTFENSTLTYQGAVDGLGVAIAQAAFVQDEIERGRLVAPFPLRVPGEASYQLVYPAAKAGMRKVRLFRDWAAREAAMTRETMAQRG